MRFSDSNGLLSSFLFIATKICSSHFKMLLIKIIIYYSKIIINIKSKMPQIVSFYVNPVQLCKPLMKLKKRRAPYAECIQVLFKGKNIILLCRLF